MSNINEDINWLKASPNRRFEVFDVQTEKPVYKSISASEILAKFETFDAFLEDLKAKGHDKIAVQKCRKHGNAQVRVGLLKKYSLEENGQGTNDQLVARGAQAHAAPSQSTTGLLGSMGLGMADIMEMHTASKNYNNEKDRADRLQLKLDHYEVENKRLDRELLKFELGVEGKPGAIEKLLNTISENPEMITTAIEALSKAKIPAPGLNAPEGENANVSKIKAALMQVVQQNEVTDQMALSAYHLISQAAKGNAEFVNAFNELIKKHVPTPNS